jgi:phytoene synthase
MSNPVKLYREVSYRSARLVTNAYSTSFGLSIRLLDKEIQEHIYAIYGMVRLADEIVDSFPELDRYTSLRAYKMDVYSAIETKFSSNPVLYAFQETYYRFGIERELIESFFHSMEMDTKSKTFSSAQFKEYVYGSAEVVGLMCLALFLRGDKQKYAQLKGRACRLGAGYQKINFLRDIRADFDERGRSYFPTITVEKLTEEAKHMLIADIQADFTEAATALPYLPPDARAAVSLSLRYYGELLRVLQKTSVQEILAERIRVSTPRKLLLFLQSKILPFS